MLKLKHTFPESVGIQWAFIKGDRYAFIDETDRTIGAPKYIFNRTGKLPDGSTGLVEAFDVCTVINDDDTIWITHYYYNKTNSMDAKIHKVNIGVIVFDGLRSVIYDIIEIDKTK